MTPTREQVIEWAKASGFVTGSFNSIDPDEVVTDGPRYITDEIERFAALAYSAGRAQGLREAMEAVQKRYMGDRNREDMEALRCADAIKQLEGK